jgi:hypothetical protein
VTATVAAIIAGAVLLGAILLAVCAAVVVGHVIAAGPPQVMLEDPTPDEPLEVDGPTSRPYIAQGGPISTGVVWERDPDEVIVPVGAKKHVGGLHRLCIEAYADRRYPDICKMCTPRMGVRP